MKPRIEWIDTAKGICILLVVYSHVYMGDHPTFMHFQDYFRMPLYFLLSGLFFKTYEGFVSFSIKKINKLIIPLLFAFTFINIPLLYYLRHRAGLAIAFPDDFWETERFKFIFEGNVTLWFLWALFLQNILFYAIFLLCRHKSLPIVLICSILGVSTFFLGQHNLYIPLWFDAALVSLPFFMTGYLLRNYSKLLYEPFRTKHWAIALASFATLILIYLNDTRLISVSNIILHGDNHFEVGCASMYIGGLCGTLFILMTAKRFTHLPIISYIGRYSIVVLLTHVTIIHVLRKILYHFTLNMDYIDLIMFGVFLLVMLIEIPIIHFGVKYLPYMFAQKDLIQYKS